MKKRYYMLPFIIIILIYIIVLNDTKITNKNIVKDNIEVNYPVFYADKIDNYFNLYLEDKINKNKNVLIDYDYKVKNNNYYITFYNHFLSNNIISNSKDNFIVDLHSSKITKTNDISFDYDFLNNKKIIKTKKMIALTFDDGPNYNTNKILNILNKYNVKATFFVLGSRIKGNEYILKKMRDSGMEIANHTYSHLMLTKYNEDKISSEIELTSKLIYENTFKYPKYLRPSYGSYNKKIREKANMPIITWSVDPQDWKYHNSKKISNKVINKVKDGDIILLHDIYSATANSLEIIIPELLKQNYDFVTISELFLNKNIDLKNGRVYGHAR